jgi:hypothetical protein
MSMKRVREALLKKAWLFSPGQIINVKPYPDTATKCFLQKKGKSNVVGRKWMRIANQDAISVNEACLDKVLMKQARVAWIRRDERQRDETLNA